MLAFELAVIIGLTLINAIFAAAEIAIVAARQPRLSQLAADGSGGARAVLELKARPELLFATVQVGISVMGATAGAFGGARFAEDLEPLFAPLPVVGQYAEGISVALVVALVAYLSIVLGELVPKSLALRHAELYACWIGRPLLALASAARPLVWFLTASSNVVLRPFGDRTTFTEGKVSAEDLQEIVEQASKSGSVDLYVGEIATRALNLEALTAKVVMIPRAKIDAVPIDATPETLQRIVLERGHSRMPVYKDSPDNIVGYLMVKDLINLIYQGQLVILHDVIRPIYFIPESMLARELLLEFQKRHTQMAIVIDEHGSVAGMVTLEDIIEELVGELFSEDEPLEALFTKEGNGLIVPGQAPLRELNRALELDLPDGDGFHTIAGLCMHLAGGVPGRGARLDVKGATIEVLEATHRVVRQVRIEPHRS
ncbi:MAG: HlyC/CorC family transporter [Deltaproteobacteria bacterium]|nr:HlyC/CorC family transporter [Deltaproteobacteria bacterium]